MAGSIGYFNNFSGGYVFQLGADKSRAFPGFYMLEGNYGK
jgi:hypothetical protein